MVQDMGGTLGAIGANLPSSLQIHSPYCILQNLFSKSLTQPFWLV
jgi:hypothetical protein